MSQYCRKRLFVHHKGQIPLLLMCVCSCPLSHLSCILYCNSFLSLMREDWRDTNWTYVNWNSACLCSYTLWFIICSKNALVDLSASIFWLVYPNLDVRECASGRVILLLSFFFLILGRTTEPAVHKYIHLSPWLDKELKRWSEWRRKHALLNSFFLPNLKQHQTFSQLWFLLSHSLPDRIWSKKEDSSIILASQYKRLSKIPSRGRAFK